MIPSPLQLETHFFTRVRVEACQDGSEPPGEGIVSCDVECRKHKKEGRKWLVRLAYKLDRDSAKGVPAYAVDVEIVGRFQVDAAFPADKVERMVRANGPAVLYGAVREMVCNLTARGPYPAVRLPTVTFIEGTAATGQPPAVRLEAPRTGRTTRKAAPLREASSKRDKSK